MKPLSILLTSLMLVLFVMSCRSPLVPTGPEDGHGSIRLRINKTPISRTIQPEVDMEVDTFRIGLRGPGTPVILTVGVDETTVKIPLLVAGNWTVTVEAANGVPEVIGSATQVVQVRAGRTEEVRITVLPLAGAGPLELTVSWPDGVVPSASMRAILYDAADTLNDPSAEFTIGVAGDRVVASYAGPWGSTTWLPGCSSPRPGRSTSSSG